MSRWGSAFRLIATAVAVTFLPGSWAANWQLFAAQAESERQRRKRDKANNRARAAFNDAQKDRLQMVDLTPDMARTLCLGRVRYVEGVRRRWSSGTHDELLTMIVSFAGHEIDAFEGWYIDDVPVTLDGSGYVQEAPWRTTANVPAQNSGTLDGSGALVIVLSHTPVGGTVTATWTNGETGQSNETGTCSVSMAGSTATLSGGRAGAAVTVNYERSVATNYVRIRTYLGTDAQNVGDALDAEYPGKITATDKFAGIALGVVNLTYSPDVFPQGPPNITAVFRGAKCYDPRLDSTVAGGSGSHRIDNPATWAWTENPALHFLRYALWSGGLRLTPAQITARTLADVVAAANRCDISTDFDLVMPDTSTDTVTLPRHRGGFTISSEADKRQVLDTICDTMAGEWAWDGPNLRVRAGMLGSTVAAIDQTWLVEGVSAGGEPDGEPIITASQAISREQRVNRITGKCVDPDQRYQLLPYPAVSDATLISAKGEKREEVDYPGVNHIAHAQHLASIEIRRRQAGTLMQLQCDPRAELLELFDVVTLTVPDYGISAKTMEVVGTDLPMGPTDAVVGVMAREITAAIYDVDATLDGRDPAPDSSLRAPWDVGTLGALTVTSGLVESVDGSLLARATITWPAVTGEWIRNGGDIELQYTRADEALPAGDWASWVEPGNSTKAIIPGLMGGRPYLFRGRLVQRLPLVKGPWTAMALVIVEAVRGRLITMARNGTEAARLILSGNSVERLAGGTAGWNAGFYSVAGITGGCRLAFTAPQANEDVFIGLSAAPTADAGFASIPYGWYLGAAGQFQVYESGTQKTTGTGYVAGTPMAIEYDGAAVKYWHGATLVRQIAAPPGLTLYVDGSLNDAGGRITSIDFAPATVTQRGNLLDSGSWVSGSSGSQGTLGGNRFTQAPPAGTNTIALGLAPDGVRRSMWRATSTGTTSYNGWEETSGSLSDVPVDHNKMYRLSVWMIPRNVSGTQGSYYFGCKPSSVRSVTSGSTDTNPIFYTASRSALVVDRPYLLVGYIMPSGSGTTQYNQGGVWDGVTGAKLANATDFKWVVDQAASFHRVAFYGSSSGNETDFWDPRFELCDGTEPRIDQMLQLAGSVRTEHVATDAATAVAAHTGGAGGFTANATGDPVRIGGTATGGSGAGAFLSYTNDTGAAVRVQFECALIGTYTGLSTWLPDAYFSYSVNGGSAVTGSLFGSGGTAPDYTIPRNGVRFGDLTLAAGDDIEIELMAVIAATRTMNWSAHQLRMTVIKR